MIVFMSSFSKLNIRKTNFPAETKVCEKIRTKKSNSTETKQRRTCLEDGEVDKAEVKVPRY